MDVRLVHYNFPVRSGAVFCFFCRFIFHSVHGLCEGIWHFRNGFGRWGVDPIQNPGRPAGGKTGTTQDYRDAWFIGFTAELVVGVWMGNDEGTRMQQVTGGGLPARLWNRIVTRALEGQPVQSLPGGVSREVKR